VAWLVAHPDAGDVIKHSGGCRKIRWSRHTWASAAAWGIHYNRLADGVIYLLLIYSKNVADTIEGRVLKQIRDVIEKTNGQAEADGACLAGAGCKTRHRRRTACVGARDEHRQARVRAIERLILIGSLL
jgi:hypothetical protein